MEGSPDEASELTSDGDDSLASGLALGEHAVEATVEPVHCLVGECDDLGGLSLTATLQALGVGLMTVVPGRLDKQASGMTVAGLGDRPASLAVGGRELGGDEAEESHQAASRVEAHEVVQLRDQTHGGEGVDATEAAQRANRSA